MQDVCVVWLPVDIYQACLAEARQHYPLETGGVFMGYWNANNVVVTGGIGAGPGACRELYNFEPDHDWQRAEIARRFNESGARETYLGDWHTHPNAATGRLIRDDRGVLRRIIDAPRARAPTPMMVIVHGADSEWGVAAWVASLRPRPVIWPKLNISMMRIRIY